MSFSRKSENGLSGKTNFIMCARGSINFSPVMERFERRFPARFLTIACKIGKKGYCYPDLLTK